MALQWLPCQAPGVIGSALGLVGPVSVYCDWVRWKVRSAADRDKDRQTDRDKDMDRNRDRDRQRQRQTDRNRQTETETDRQRQRQTETKRLSSVIWKL